MLIVPLRLMRFWLFLIIHPELAKIKSDCKSNAPKDIFSGGHGGISCSEFFVLIKKFFSHTVHLSGGATLTIDHKAKPVLGLRRSRTHFQTPEEFVSSRRDRQRFQRCCPLVTCTNSRRYELRNVVVFRGPSRRNWGGIKGCGHSGKLIFSNQKRWKKIRNRSLARSSPARRS